MINWDEIEESKDGEHVPAGVYVIYITNAVDNPSKEYNEFGWDIAEGEYKNNYATAPDWMHRLIRSYKETALPMYKQFFRRTEDSNPGFRFDGNEHNPAQFVGKKLGVVLREEEYEGNDGTTKVRLSIAKIGSVDDAKNGTLKPMRIKKLEGSSSTSSQVSTSPAPAPAQQPALYEDVPF